MAKPMWSEEEVEALRQMYSDIRISREEMEERFARPLNGTKPFLNTVKKYLEHNAQVKLSKIYRVHKDRSPHLFKIIASSREAVCKIDALINASGLGLPRKHL